MGHTHYISRKKKQKGLTCFKKIKVVLGEKSKHILTCFESLSGLHSVILIVVIIWPLFHSSVLFCYLLYLRFFEFSDLKSNSDFFIYLEFSYQAIWRSYNHTSIKFHSSYALMEGLRGDYGDYIQDWWVGHQLRVKTKCSQLMCGLPTVYPRLVIEMVSYSQWGCWWKISAII